MRSSEHVRAGSGLRTKFGAARRRMVGSSRAALPVEHPVRHDLKVWATSWDAAEYSVLEPARLTTRPLPRTVEVEVDASFAPLCSFPVPERALVKIPNGRVRGRAGLVVLPNGEFAGELVAMTADGQHTILRAERAYYEPLPERSIVRKGNYYPVLGLGVDHYYHWSHDVIMRMRGIADRLPTDIKLIVPEGMQPFQLETLSLLGLDDRERVPFPATDVWELENLYVVKPTLKTQIDSPEPYRWFREAAMARYGIAEVPPMRRLLVTRRHDEHWRTTNEDEVDSLLSKYGFETVAPARLSFREQIELFGQADIIVGTGAGLMNMVFSPPGTQILQFQDPGHVVHALWTMAAAMDFDYHYLLCDPVLNPAAGIADVHVPIEKLEAAITQLIASRAT
jgi:Glycosyltransferase 61